MRIAARDQNLDDAVDQVFAQQGRSGAVGIGIHADALALAQALEQSQRLDGAAPVARPGAFVVRQDPGNRPGQRRIGRLLHRLEDTVHLGANVGDVNPRMPCHHLHQGLHLSRICRKGLLIKEPGRKPQRALPKRPIEQLGHGLDLAGIGRATQIGHGAHAQRGVADERADIDGRWRRAQRVGVLAELRKAKLGGVQQVQRRRRLAGHQGHERQAAIAGDHAGHALRQLGQHDRVAQHLRIVVGVNVDKAWA